MDGKSRWADNVMIERWFRTFKYEEAYLTQYSNIREARHAIRKYVKVYNYQRCHSAIGNVPPAEIYYPAMLLDAAKAAAWFIKNFIDFCLDMRATIQSPFLR